MANSLNAIFEPKLSIAFKQGFTLGSNTDNLVAGGAALPTLNKSLQNGTGAGKASLRHAERYSFAAGNTDLDLRSLATTRAPGGNQIFSLIKWFILRIVTPATGQKLVIGNYGASGFVGWMGANNVPLDVQDQEWRINQIDGWTVDASHRYLRVNNPGVSAIDADLILVGE